MKTTRVLVCSWRVSTTPLTPRVSYVSTGLRRGEVEPHSSALCPQNAFHSQLPPMASDSGFPFLEVIKRSFNHEFIYYYY